MAENNENKVTISELLVKIKETRSYLKAKRWLIIAVTLFGILCGLAAAVLIKPKYTAVYTFALEDGDQGGLLGQYAGLAALAGFGSAGGSSVFKGDNILELYKSRSMIEKALLTEADFNGKKELLIDRYININKLREAWVADKNVGNITFDTDYSHFSRKQDSIISSIAFAFNKKGLDVTKPDKKLSVIQISFTSPDELFAQKFTDALVNNVNAFYVQTKTKKASLNVTLLQHQADSIKAVLSGAIYGVASSIDAAPNANPGLTSLRVPSQKKQIDVQANTAIYSEIVKNLELSKITLRQQTPLIQYIDQPVLPLTKNKLGKAKGMLIGGILCYVLIVSFLVVQKWARAILQ